MKRRQFALVLGGLSAWPLLASQPALYRGASKALDTSIPPTLLARADEVIE